MQYFLNYPWNIHLKHVNHGGSQLSMCSYLVCM